MTTVNLPYFDSLLEELGKENPELKQAFGRHVHWGYWPEPRNADGSVADFAKAAERLSEKVCAAGGVQNGLRILDAGCGFGGTIALMNERFSPINLVGLNIDARQLTRAQEQVLPRPNNTIEFVQGDACAMPFEDNSFDIVFAVECIFHFPSREKFFQEARRVLRPGGKLALCDFVALELVNPIFKTVGKSFGNSIYRTYGQVKSDFTASDYRQLAAKTGFKASFMEDITPNTVPTYPVVRQVQRTHNQAEIEKVTAMAEWLARLGWVRYQIWAFDVA
ncbi:MAG TPA: class I SAM-dependent methyltransferase [Oscillatoriaceae cyanobacterium M33_DOE_052]|uniref:Class I SAM-dependent methyltransferase n=1 Tax=Planktothricoides sp. SpSt-374 TaxID=2282167 RepID=A0A7C3VM49_9CYAN|nr:class I SAM-dependent methyltransferase [Oscillatoriaceae cyanobacterium M33_DOE_052]